MRPASMIQSAAPGAGSSYVSKTDMVAALIRWSMGTAALGPIAPDRRQEPG